MTTPRTRVFFLIPSLVAHGAERQFCELTRRLDRAKFEVHVAVFYGPENGNDGNLWQEISAIQDISLHCLNKRRGLLGYLVSLPRLFSLMRKARPDVVHGYMDGNMPILLLGRLLGTRVVWGIRRSNTDWTKLDRVSRLVLKLMVKSSRLVHMIIFNSEAGRQNHMAMGMQANYMEVVPNGFDVDRFRPDPAKGLAQRKVWGIPAEAPLIGIVGRLNPVKDHPTFLRAAARLAVRWPEARFICVGGGPEPYKASLMALAKTLRIEAKVHFPGASGDMTAAYNALSCLVLSSVDEGFPNVLGEAMACGVPCVTTRVGDAEALIGPWGFAVEPGNDQAIATAVSSLLLESSEERDRRSVGVRQRISTTYSVEALVKHTEHLLLGLMPTRSTTTTTLG